MTPTSKTTTPTVSVTVSSWAVRVDDSFVGSVYDNGTDLEPDFHATTGRAGVNRNFLSREEAVAAIVDYHTHRDEYAEKAVRDAAIAMCERSAGKGAWESTSESDRAYFLADAKAALDAMRGVA